MRKGLVEQVVDTVIDRIVEGAYREGDALPGEVDLAKELDVSRLTVREAVKVLKDRGVLEVQQGRGTFLAPRTRWTDLSTVIALTMRESSPRDAGLRLVELRRMIEVGAAGLAARNRTDEDLEALESLLERIDEAAVAGDVEANVDADLDFHRRILLASANPFMPVVLAPLAQALHESRFVTASQPEVRRRAQAHHRAILDAIRSKDEEAAKDAMRSHMTQTRLDLLANTAE
ncbi:MAG: FadR/GntR family transcriptional regulator [Schaalia turicensis]